MIKYFILSDKNGLPAKIAMGLYIDGVKLKGHKMLPVKLTEKTKCFDGLDEIRRQICNCGNPICVKNQGLANAVKNFQREVFL